VRFLVDPVVAEHVAAEFRRGDEPGDATFHRAPAGAGHPHTTSRTAPLRSSSRGQLLLALGEWRLYPRCSPGAGDVAAGVIPGRARPFELVVSFTCSSLAPERERFRLHRRLFPCSTGRTSGRVPLFRLLSARSSSNHLQSPSISGNDEVLQYYVVGNSLAVSMAIGRVGQQVCRNSTRHYRRASGARSLHHHLVIDEQNL